MNKPSLEREVEVVTPTFDMSLEAQVEESGEIEWFWAEGMVFGRV